jgi:hypothetical protein
MVSFAESRIRARTAVEPAVGIAAAESFLQMTSGSCEGEIGEKCKPK